MTEPPNTLPPSSAAVRAPMLGRYQLLKKIGLGGMAEIWVARAASISGVEKICVVKRILPHLADSPEFVRMFLDEARIAATLTHPNLIQMYDIEEVDGMPIIAMEFLHGEDLRNIRKELRGRKQRMALPHALTIAIGIAAGLHYAHEKVGIDGTPLNIVHRDLSPHNIFITYDGGVKILDFGIAKAANRSNETRDGALKGKVPYMSPEQCRSELLDRRSDIYSLGTILYELTTGNRIFRRGASEFEIMRAIVEDPVTPPTRTTIDYPEELARVVLKCLAKKRAERYATARDLQVDLEAFARDHRLATGALELSSFMGELFGQRVEAWRDAIATGGDLLSQLASQPPPSSEIWADEWMGDADGGDAGVRSHRADEILFATKRSAPLGGPGRGAEPAPASVDEPPASVASRVLGVTKRKMGRILVVSLSGRMTEAFQGQILARELSGRVLFDLAGVERVTSFGVRAWLEMLNGARPRVTELCIARCSEPIVNQVSMIRRFAGEGRIVSFYGPYRCEGCGGAFHRLFDCERDAEAIRTAEPPDSPCPRCGAMGTFDDDAESYFAFAASYSGVRVPEDVRAVLEELAKADAGGGPGDAIEKIIDERATRVRVGCKLDGTVRWKRALDGIEGDLVIDLSNATGTTPEGVRGLELTLRALGDEVSAIRIEGCPWSLLEHLTAAKPPLRVEIVSVLVDARCESCSAMRPTLLDIQEGVAAALEDTDPYVPCKRCNAPLSFASLRPALRGLGSAGAEPEAAAPEAAAPEAAAPEVAGAAASAPGAVAEATPAARGRTPVVLVAVLAAGVALGLGLAYRGERDPGSRAAVATTDSAGPGPSAASAPAWMTGPRFLVEGERIVAVGRGEGADREEALAAARNDAIVEISEQILGALAGSDVHAFIRTHDVEARRADTLEAEAQRYLSQVGAFATPERVDAQFREREGAVRAVARYRLKKEGFDAAVAAYRRTVTLSGMTATTFFPTLERKLGSTGNVIVIAVDEKGPAAAGVRVGDVIVGVNGRAVSGLDAFETLMKGLGAQGAVRPSIEVELDVGGAHHKVKLPRP